MNPMISPAVSFARPLRRPVLTALAALCLAFAGTCAQAQASGGMPGTADSTGRPAGSGSGPSGSASGAAGASSSRLAAADRTFMTRAAGGGMFEVEVARLAADKASDEAVKRFAKTLMDQHSAANEELTSLAAAKGVTLPTSMPADKKRIVDRLSKQSGAEFDRDFVQMVGIKDHQEDIRLFEKASRDARDPEVKAWAAKTLPVLQQHLAQARQLPMAQGSKSASGAGSSAPRSSGSGSAGGSSGAAAPSGYGSGSGSGSGAAGGSTSSPR